MAQWLGWLNVALVVYIAQLAFIFVTEHRRPFEMRAWLFIAFVCPYIGIAAYLVLGQEFVRRRHFSRFKEATFELAIERSSAVAKAAELGLKQQDQLEKLFAMLAGLAPFPITRRNTTKVLTNGYGTYETIFQELERARHHIHLDYYTIRDDDIGKKFLRVLSRKARDGVEVRVVYDGIGSMKLSEAYIQELRVAGVQTSCFLPPRFAFFDKRLNYRNHRKIVVVDGKVGFVGGINIGDEYLGKDAKLGFWRDTHLRLEGDAVYFLQELFLQDWAYAAKEQLNGKKYMQAHGCEGEERVLVVSSKPGLHDQKIKEVMLAAIMMAKTRVYVTTPYFIPDAGILMGLRLAALTGIDVRLVIPKVADSRLVLRATMSYIQEMLEAGVKVYRYEKGFIHAKVLIVDEVLASVGTANVDMRSLYSNFELNAVMFDLDTIRRLESDFWDDLQHSHQMDFEAFQSRPLKQKLAESALRLLSPLL
ncbi:cardiolipin synthase [Paenibacillus sp. sgz302251]|uniref:cardiolipin synthase n=1 Tax=Paenibacillus sp. sgz302251 TaxID=3414493 RepID=UPI003C7AA549